MKIPSVLNTNGSMTVNTPTPTTDINESKDTEIVQTKGSTFSVRHVQCVLIFIGLSVAYALRVNLSVAIVAMTDKNATNPDFDEYTWDEKTKSLLLSSFFWGYVITQVPAGSLARKVGGKVMLLYGISICSALAILTPICARIGNWQLVCALRVIQGLSQGALFPSTHTILSKWSPIEERGALSTYCYSGSQFGTALMLASSGVIASSSIGWPSIFYISGGTGLVWAFAWYFWGASSPEDSKTIGVEERKLIEMGQNVESAESKQAMATPWTKIFTSPAFLVLILTHSTYNWGFWTLLTEMPSYMKNILGLDIKSNALLSSLPYFAMFLLCFVFSAIQSVLSKRQCLLLSWSRKIFNSIGNWVPVVSLIFLAYVGKDEINLAIFLLTITVGINASTYLGAQVNHIDLSPNFAGILMGITNCSANCMSIIAPLFVGLIVTDEHNPDQWRIIFFIAAGFYFIGNLLFIIFGRVTVQPWNDPQTLQDMSLTNSKHIATMLVKIFRRKKNSLVDRN